VLEEAVPDRIFRLEN